MYPGLIDHENIYEGLRRPTSQRGRIACDVGDTIFRATATHMLYLVPSRRQVCQNYIQISILLLLLAVNAFLDVINILKQYDGNTVFIDLTEHSMVGLG